MTTDLRDFALINPCGITDKPVTSLEREAPCPATLPNLEAMADEAARQFGNVFKQPVVAVRNVDELLAHACQDGSGEQTPPHEFPAQDTPLRIPEDLERLRGGGSPLERG